jgi:F-type H+-transporting ATPase subunit gamma
MASLKDIRKRIGSVRNTQKITRAMKMVAAAKLRRSQQSLMAARPYAAHMAKLVGHLAALESEEPAHPLLQPREEVKIVRLVLLTSDRGFCGGFNGSLLRRVEEWLVNHREQYENIQLHVIGRKGRDFFRARGHELYDFESGVYENFNIGEARQQALKLVAEFEAGAWDECYFVYNQFKTAITQEVTFKKVVPVTAELQQEETHGKYVPDYIYEPAAPRLLSELLPRYLATDIFRIFLESIASEFGARMVAMDSATNNCSDLIDSLTLTANRLRQAAITSELMDIVNGAEALEK